MLCDLFQRSDGRQMSIHGKRHRFSDSTYFPTTALPKALLLSTTVSFEFWEFESNTFSTAQESLLNWAYQEKKSLVSTAFEKEAHRITPYPLARLAR